MSNRGDRFNDKDACCDYCGLNLSPSELQNYLIEKRDSWDNKLERNRLLEAGLEELFDNPYSKIFSFIETEGYFIDNFSQQAGFGSNFSAGSFMYYVKGEDGKKYHPYCARKLGIKE